jgi:hypothetical protein
MGLIADKPMFLAANPRLKVASGFTVPPYSDLRPYLLPASNQGTTPQCVAYAVAGWIEVDSWCRTHLPIQVPPAPIYAEAKRLDGAPESDGTTLEAGIKAAQNLGYIPQNAVIRIIRTAQEMQFALHTRVPVISAFNVSPGWETVNPKNGFISEDARVLGGHAVLVCWCAQSGVEMAGVDRTEEVPENYGWQNSWGAWGLNGLGRMTRRQFDRQFAYGCVIEGATA